MRALIVFLLLLLPVFAFPQTGGNPDSLFSAAREEAYAGHYKEAITHGKALCAAYPSNSEYRLFTARVMAWNQAYAESKAFAAPLRTPPSAEVLDLLSDVALWSADYDSVLVFCDAAMAIPGTDPAPFLLKKAQAFEQLGQLQDAIDVLEQLIATGHAQVDAQRMLERLRDQLRKNRIGISYLNNAFGSPGFAPWHFGYVEYMRSITQCPVIARVNYGNVTGLQAFQGEVDAYPKLGRKAYLYMNAAFSGSADLFPQFKAGLELYHKVYRRFEVSAGARYMKFTAENVVIYTAYAGYYYNNWWFSGRGYVVAPESRVYTTWAASARHYLGDENRYVSLDLVYGAVPYVFSSLQDIARTSASRIGVQAQLRAGKTFYIRPFVMYELEEYFPGSFRNRWDTQLTLMKKF